MPVFDWELPDSFIPAIASAPSKSCQWGISKCSVAAIFCSEGNVLRQMHHRETDPGPGHKCLNTVGGCQDLDLCLLYTARGVMGQTDALWSWCKASCRIRQPGLEAPGRSLWWGPKAPCCCSVVGPPAAGYGDAARPRLAEYAICQLNVESDEPHCALQLGVSSCCRSGEASWSAGSLNAKHISDYVAGLVAGLQSLRQAVGAYRHSFASRATPVT